MKFADETLQVHRKNTAALCFRADFSRVSYVFRTVCLPHPFINFHFFMSK